MSFGVQAAVGVALNVLILFYGGSGSLGVFNQIYAVFVISGQLAVFGLHDSVQKHVAEFSHLSDKVHIIALSSLVMAGLSGLAGALLLLFGSEFIGELFKSLEVGRGIGYMAPGLMLFTLNKALMGILNGKRRMIAFAIGQSIRALSILFVCLVIISRGMDAALFGLAFTLAEVVLFVCLMVFVRTIQFQAAPSQDLIQWMKRHFQFGSKALVHGFLSEAFIRIDILMLGVFLSDSLVGIYSFAAFFLEGAYQVPVVIRTISNPILVRLVSQDRPNFVSFTRRTALLSFGATLCVAGGITIFYPYMDFFMTAEVIEQSFPVLVVLMSGLVLFSICIPFDYIFLLAGKPGVQSIYMATNTGVNIMLNLILIPRYGILGASLATAMAFLWSIIFLNIMVASMLKFRGGLFVKRQEITIGHE